MIYLFGLSVSFFLFVLILLKKDKRRPDYILLTWIGVIVIHLFLFIIHDNELAYRYPHLLGIGLPLPILHGSFLYFYTTELIRKDHISVKWMMVHLIPFFILVILAIPFYRLPASEKIVIFQNQGRGFEWYIQIQVAAFLIAGFAYSIASIVEIRKYRKRILNSLSNVDKKMLRWLEYLSLGLAIIWLLSAFFNDQIVFDGVVLFVLFIGFFGINQYPVFYSIPIENSNVERPSRELLSKVIMQEELPEESGKYAKSRLSDDEASRVMGLLETVMRTEQPFKNANLTLNDLADAINVSPNDLSQAINTVAGKTFYHYINTYRIQEFLELSSSSGSRRFTYLGLASQCGFSSKTTFNKYFKLETGKTPSAYLELESEITDAG